MPFEPDEITTNCPPFIQSLCRSLYREYTLVHLPEQALFGEWGMGSEGRIALLEGIPGQEGREAREIQKVMPPTERRLPPNDEGYRALVRESDASEREPKAHRDAAFRRMGGHVPERVQNADPWKVVNLYEAQEIHDGLIHFRVYSQFDQNVLAKIAATHYTQSANLVAVHPVVHHLIPEYRCILKTLQARAFATFRYDPANQFAPGSDHDSCGFVV